MATRGKRSRKNAPARKARRPVARKDARARKAAAALAGRRRTSEARPSGAARAGSAARAAAPIVRRSIRPISAGWSTLRVVWRPAISMATLPYRVYRVYRWAAAESSRSAVSASAPR